MRQNANTSPAYIFLLLIGKKRTNKPVRLRPEELKFEAIKYFLLLLHIYFVAVVSMLIEQANEECR